jgi:hypothetical protein
VWGETAARCGRVGDSREGEEGGGEEGEGVEREEAGE